MENVQEIESPTKLAVEKLEKTNSTVSDKETKPEKTTKSEPKSDPVKAKPIKKKQGPPKMF